MPKAAPAQIHTGPGVYSSVPATKTPFWAVVLGAIGALIVIGLMVVALLLRRGRRRGAEEPDGHLHVRSP